MTIDNKNPTLSFWQEQAANPQGMMLNHRATEIDEPEQAEIISYLPNLTNATILELGAGIGRYTKYFSAIALSVIAVDFVEKFLDQNKAVNAEASNITYCCGNAMDIKFPRQTFDFIFVNWLMMYLSDHDARELIPRMHASLRPKGRLFLRESCFNSSNPISSHSHTHYRDSTFYESLFPPYFTMLSKGNIKLYERIFNNPNQIFWILQRQ